MTKINKILIGLILIATIFLGVGYSVISNITLDISGTITAEKSPSYIPTGFSKVEGTSLDTGYTIQDSLGNQYVWIEVPQTLYDDASYNTKTTTGDKKPTSSTDYDNIEYCLHQYTSVYRNNTDNTDTWYSKNPHGLTEEAYYELKEKMLKSVYENGGFYVGKYETGTATARTSSSSSLTTPVIKQNAYPYNYVTCSQAQALASNMTSGNYTSSLMFGVQWDLVLKYLETKEAATEAELNEDSTAWGNYYYSDINITNASSKYYDDYSKSWVSEAYGSKVFYDTVLLSTGASDTFMKMGIYDLAGNVQEYTLETCVKNFIGYYYVCIARGGDYRDPGYDDPGVASDEPPASDRYVGGSYNYTDIYTGFRISIF